MLAHWGERQWNRWGPVGTKPQGARKTETVGLMCVGGWDDWQLVSYLSRQGNFLHYSFILNQQLRRDAVAT